MSPALRRFVLEELAASFFALTRSVISTDLSAFRTELMHAPWSGLDYACYFPGPVAFRARQTRISGPAAILSTPQLGHDRETFELLLAILRKDRDGASKPLHRRLEDYFIANPHSSLNLSDAAVALGMSARPLERQLAAEGQSFRAVLASFRHAWARQLLGSSTLSMAQTAHVLGYRAENSFRRAFRHWSGVSIARWRRRRRQ